MLRASAKTIFAYRVSFLFGSVGAIFQLLAMVALWTALLRNRDELAGFSLTDMKSYLLVGYATGVLGTGFGEQWMAERIRSGAVSLDLVKPLNYQKARFAESLGGLPMEVALVVVVGTVFTSFAGPVMTPAYHLLFLISLLAVVPIKFMILYVSTLICFWTQNYHGVSWARNVIVAVFSGALVPLVFLPQWVNVLATALPFASITSTPALIFIGRISEAEAARLVGLQLMWVVLLWYIGQFAWRRSVRHLTVHGG
ncbi:hypothetical protein GCM10027186_18900 [Micromonospora schwarzwaldensis]